MPKSRPPRRFVQLRESAATATATATATRLVEAVSAGAVSTTSSGRLLIQLISEGWGTSGYYGGPVIAETARDNIFRAGTQMFLDHPTADEDAGRPERSVKDLAAVLTTDARWDEARRSLVAEAKPMPLYRDLLNDADFVEAVGLSIRAGGIAEHGTAEGRSGMIIQRITEAQSVDFVTRAGRGGKVLALLESARTRLSEAPTEQTRAALDRAIHDAYDRDDRYAWVRDWDPDRSIVWYDLGGPDGGTWEQSYLLSGTDIALIGPRREVKPVTVYQPVSAVGPLDTPEAAAALGESGTTTTDVTGGTPPTDPPNPTEGGPDMSGTNTGGQPGQAGTAPVDAAAIQESERRAYTAETARDTALREAAEATTRATAAEQRAATAETALARYQAVEAARPIAEAALRESGLPTAAQQRVMAGISPRIPLANGVLDQAALHAIVSAEITAEQAYLADLAESQGAGRVTGFGGTAQPTAAAGGGFVAQGFGAAPAGQAGGGFVQAGAPAQANSALVEAYVNRGMTQSAAELAARGRP
jgi:hypothetical protein